MLGVMQRGHVGQMTVCMHLSSLAAHFCCCFALTNGYGPGMPYRVVFHGEQQDTHAHQSKQPSVPISA